MNFARKPLLILDLNGTLCISQHRPVAGKRADAKPRSKYIYIRPNLNFFLEFVFAYFRVAVWSSNAFENTLSTVEVLFTPEQIQQLEFIWSRDQCIAPDQNGDYSSVKPLKKVLNREGSLLHVTIIDDTPSKIADVQIPRNHYAISPYDEPDERDTGLIAALQWLDANYRITA